MLFNSFEFLYFFILVYAAYLFVNKKFQNLILLVASYCFYASWDWRFLSLLIISTLVDFHCGKVIAATSRPALRRSALALSITTNLGLLGFFKYYNFFLDSAVSLLGNWVDDPGKLHLSVVLPVGISFYTFQTLSYTIDIYRRKIRPTRNLLDFAVFVSYFPQLVAGPIERASNLLPQIQKARTLTYSMVRQGAWLVLLGYFKKVVVADNMAPIADRLFGAPEGASALQVLLGVYAYAFQIYGDFSGYSDIARGVSKLMGIDLMWNFRMPYFALNPRDFWGRWHISLSSWLRDYLYIPLGGSRTGRVRNYVNLMLTMLLGGLWHGAAWHFVAWGLFHGCLLIVHRALQPLLGLLAPTTGIAGKLWKGLCIVGFFHLTCVGWVLFRVERLADIPVIWQRATQNINMTYAPGALWMEAACLLVFVLPLVYLELAKQVSGDMLVVKLWRPGFRYLLYCMLFSYIVTSGVTDGNEFIYFQF